MVQLCRFLIAPTTGGGESWGMILVTGATGTTGSEVVRGLLGRGERVRAMSRRPIALHGAETVVADFDDRASLERALDGVRAVYLVSAPLKPVIDHDAALVEAARAAGVGRIVKLGAISGADEATWHHRSEQPRPRESSRLDRPASVYVRLEHAPVRRTGPAWRHTAELHRDRGRRRHRPAGHRGRRCPGAHHRRPFWTDLHADRSGTPHLRRPGGDPRTDARYIDRRRGRADQGGPADAAQRRTRPRERRRDRRRHGPASPRCLCSPDRRRHPHPRPSPELLRHLGGRPRSRVPSR